MPSANRAGPRSPGAVADRILDVFIERSIVGALGERDGVWTFKYDAAWLESATCFPIAPGLPLQAVGIVDGGTHRPVQWFFDNLLPEEDLRERLAKETHIEAADAFGLLERYGAESAGALTLLAPGAARPDAGRRALSDSEIRSRIRALPRTSLEARAPKKMSLAGAQHKLPVILDDGLFEPVGSEPSTHILKPDHRQPDRYPSSAVNEWYVMHLAANLGLPVPVVIHRYCPDAESKQGNEALFIVERFDRRKTPQGTARIHAIDACQLMNVDRSFKYGLMSAETLRRIADTTRSRAATRLRLFRWCIFNAITGNADAHLKNLSFLVTRDGIELAPFYDLIATAIFESEKPGSWGTVKMPIEIGRARQYGKLSRDDCVTLASELRIAERAAVTMLDQMLRAMEAESDRLLAGFEEKPFPRSASAQRAGETRVLRQIRRVVIHDMLKRLAPR